MESTDLLQFFNQVQRWPESLKGLDELASKIRTFLDAERVAMSADSRGEIAVSDPHQRSVIADSIRNLPKPDSSDKTLYFTIQSPAHNSNSANSNRKGFLYIGFRSPPSPIQKVISVAILQWLGDLFAKADFEESIQARNQFLSIASHELKTPLTAIYGILQLQERMLRVQQGKGDAPTFPEQERHHSFLKMVIRQVERLNDLIDGLLDVSRIQNNRFMVEPSETNVSAVLRDCTQNRLAVIAKEASVKLHVDIISEVIARVDPVRIEEVINNLIMNAIRFSPEGGVVWIRLREEEGAFRLTVRDQGPSISMEDRERIFHPFERVKSQTRLGGLGLGLFISRQIALLHGGNVSLVESVPGKGNVFEAYFPTRMNQRESA